MNHYVPSTRGTKGKRRRQEHVDALRALTKGVSIVYAVRLKDGMVKIGCSEDLAQRRWSVGHQTTVLGFMPGTMDDEQAIHASLIEHRAHGREYYHPTPEVLAVVNGMRDAFSLPHIAA